MAENYQENNNQDKKPESGSFNFVQEKVVSKKAKRMKRIAIIVITTLVCAVVFGFVARFVFIKSDTLMMKLCGITPTPVPTTTARQEIKFPTEQPTPVATEAPTFAPSATPEVTPTEAPEVTPTKAPEVTEPAQSDSAADTAGSLGVAMETYKELVRGLREVSGNASKSLVKVTAVTNEVNWLSESIVDEKQFSAVYMGDNGVELLFIANYEYVKGADTITVDLSASVGAEAVVYNVWSDCNVAILAVDKSALADGIPADLKVMELGSSAALTAGTPIIALGSPNGTNGSVEYGFVTATGGSAFVTDGKVDLFYTDINNVDGSDGVIINLDGQLVGFITKTLSAKEAVNSSTVLGLSSIEKVVLSLLNKTERNYLGIKAEDIPVSDLSRLELETGIYVSDVVDGSPADKAGVKKGDIIKSIKLQSVEEPTLIRSVSGYMVALAQAGKGDSIEVDIFRNSKPEDSNITLAVTVGVKQ